MKYFFDEFNNQDRSHAEEKLIQDKYYISLDDLHRVYLSNLFKYSMQQFGEKNSEAEEKTLQYLYPLLKEGKLKMRMCISEENTDPQARAAYEKECRDHGHVPTSGKLWKQDLGYIYTTPESIDADIAKLRNDWNTSLPVDLTALEMSIHFTLPENPWQD